MSLSRPYTPFLKRFFHRTPCCPALSPTTQNEQVDSAVNWAHQALKRELPLLPRTTVAAHNVPREASLQEFLRLVLFGPLFRIDDRRKGPRIISLTFYDTATATAFYQEMAGTEVVLHGARLKFAWAAGQPPRRKIQTRALYIHDVHRLGTMDQFHRRISQYGFLEHVSFAPGTPAAFVHFLNAATAIRVRK
jgi:hypothetical protein